MISFRSAQAAFCGKMSSKISNHTHSPGLANGSKKLKFGKHASWLQRAELEDASRRFLKKLRAGPIFGLPRAQIWVSFRFISHLLGQNSKIALMHPLILPIGAYTCQISGHLNNQFIQGVGRNCCCSTYNRRKYVESVIIVRIF